jgi:hypothetical protein
MTARLGLYADIQPILDEALRSNGGSVTLASHGAAVNWRHRAYRFRKAFAATALRSPYDTLTFPKIPADSTTVTINLIQPVSFTPRAPHVDEAPQPDDEMMAEAQSLFNQIFGDEE